ncbi:MAG: hypothetical protein IJ661_07155 [Lachnospiraceae bacterium]|nr:hypothetical protein [Lachnospiraceae bacterium]
MKLTKKMKLTMAGLLSLSLLASIALPINVNAESTETINVVTTLTGDNDYSETYTYDSNGLITKKANSYDVVSKYTYKKGLLTKMTTKSSGYTDKYTYKYDKKNRVIKMSGKSSDGFKTTSTYKYGKKNRVAKQVYKESGPEAIGTPLNYTYTYNKNGYITKEKHSGFDKNSVSYAYDANGNMTKSKDKNTAITVENTYEDGKLVSQKITTKAYGEVTTSTKTYTYQEVTVPKKYVNTVKAQQRAILNTSIPRFVY